MKTWKYFAGCAAVLVAISCVAQTDKRASPPPPPTRTAAVHDLQAEDGQRAFDQNCSRCHFAPQGFSPHISGTVVMHMRVRAGLSKKDEQSILRFLNP